MAFRIFYIIRSVINYSIYTDPYSKKLCQQYGFSANIRYTLKAQLFYEPFNTVTFIFLIWVVFFSYLYRMFEMPFYRTLSPDDLNYRQLDSFFNSVYATVITLTTVGYGDLAPCTPLGRCVAMMMALGGTCLFSIILLVAN